jgi:transcriptional regulator with XRE-family HTH domain
MPVSKAVSHRKRPESGRVPDVPRRPARTKAADRQSLGAGVRRLRQQRGWTLAELSRQTGLAISTLSKVENNQISLTYHNLAKLAAGMEVDLADFFAPEWLDGDRARQVVCRRGEGHLHETANYAHEYLCAELPARAMIPVCTRVKARSLADFGKTIAHPGDEFIYVLEGAVDIHVGGGEPVRLRAGDGFYFDGRAGHAAVSVGIGDALILTVISNQTGR